MEFVSKSLEDTSNFAKTLSKRLKVGDVVTLTGDLGAGKTTFVKYLVQALGSKDDVTSPSFTIINEYQGNTKIYHMDMYRLETLDEAMMTGFLDCVNAKDGICLIEWPQIVESVLPKNKICVTIKNNNNIRKFDVEGI